MKDSKIYVGVKGSIVALNRTDGAELWRTKLKGSGFVVAVLDGDLVLAHTKGELFGLRAETGEILWNNGLDGLGYGYATITSPNVSGEQVVAVIRQIMAEEDTDTASTTATVH